MVCWVKSFSKSTFLFAGPPKISLPSRFETTTAFEKGENIVIKIPFRANPKPDFKWTKNGQELKEGSRYKQEVSYHSNRCSQNFDCNYIHRNK